LSNNWQQYTGLYRIAQAGELPPELVIQVNQHDSVLLAD
jgi:hypothetical protein